MLLRHDDLSAIPGTAHGFFTRRGGVSDGIYATLNCGPGSSDDPVHVVENRRRVAETLGAPALVSLHQVHGPEVAMIDAVPTERPRADGMVTNRPGIALGILTADCAPILFADRRGRAVGACHAGWRGALTGVWRATLDALEGLGVARGEVVAVVGPTIGGTSYEVGPEFPAPFLAADPAHQVYFRPAARAGHFLFDLPRYLVDGLSRAGVGCVRDLGCDTLTDPDRFFSYRRTTIAGEPDYGRQISAIALIG